MNLSDIRIDKHSRRTLENLYKAQEENPGQLFD